MNPSILGLPCSLGTKKGVFPNRGRSLAVQGSAPERPTGFGEAKRPEGPEGPEGAGRSWKEKGRSYGCVI